MKKSDNYTPFAMYRESGEGRIVNSTCHDNEMEILEVVDGKVRVAIGTEIAEAKKAEAKKSAIDRPEMKENSDGSTPAPRAKTEGGKKSLHYIDEEEFPNGRYPDVDEYLAAKKAEKEAAAEADTEGEKTELNGEIQE